MRFFLLANLSLLGTALAVPFEQTETFVPSSGHDSAGTEGQASVLLHLAPRAAPVRSGSGIPASQKIQEAAKLQTNAQNSKQKLEPQPAKYDIRRERTKLRHGRNWMDLQTLQGWHKPDALKEPRPADVPPAAQMKDMIKLPKDKALFFDGDPTFNVPVYKEWAAKYAPDLVTEDRMWIPGKGGEELQRRAKNEYKMPLLFKSHFEEQSREAMTMKASGEVFVMYPSFSYGLRWPHDSYWQDNFQHLADNPKVTKITRVFRDGKTQLLFQRT